MPARDRERFRGERDAIVQHLRAGQKEIKPPPRRVRLTLDERHLARSTGCRSVWDALVAQRDSARVAAEEAEAELAKLEVGPTMSSVAEHQLETVARQQREGERVATEELLRLGAPDLRATQRQIEALHEAVEAARGGTRWSGRTHELEELLSGEEVRAFKPLAALDTIIADLEGRRGKVLAKAHEYVVEVEPAEAA